MTLETKWQAAGLSDAFVSYRNENGIFNGFSNLQAANTGIGSGARRMYKIDTLPNPVPSPVRVRPRGDNGYGYVFTFPGGDIPEADAIFGEADITLDAALHAGTNHTLGDWLFNANAPTLPTLSNMILLTHSDAVSTESATAGLRGFENRLYGNVQMLPLDRESQVFQGEATYRYSIAISPMTVLPWGGLFSSSNFTIADGQYIRWFSQYRTMLHAFVGDNALTTVTVDHIPVSAAKTKAFTLSGTTATPIVVNTVNTSTRVITLASAPTSGQLVVILYEASRLL